MRKIVQISSWAVPAVSGEHEEKIGVVALCDDGTVFERFLEYGDQWRQLPPIPQPESDPRI